MIGGKIDASEVSVRCPFQQIVALSASKSGARRSIAELTLAYEQRDLSFAVSKRTLGSQGLEPS